MEERVQKILAAAGVGSRRAAEEWIRAGRVTVNGSPAHVGDRADPERDAIALDGVPLDPAPFRYWILNKPPGVLTTRRDPFGRPTVMDLLPAAAHGVYPVGRLDRDTEGLLVLTNDGSVTQALLHPSLGTEKEYRVTVRGPVEPETLRRLAAGVELRDGPTAPARVVGARFDRRRDVTRFRLVIHEGRKRQIRRALGKLGHPVEQLVRLRMGPLRLGDLPPGEARPLTATELRRLRAHSARVLGQRAGRPAAGKEPVQPDVVTPERRAGSSRLDSRTRAKFLARKGKSE